MTEYPEDVMAAARKHCDLAGVTPHSDMRMHCEHIAAFAIMAERERCAGVAMSTCIEVGEAHLGMLVHASVTKGATT